MLADDPIFNVLYREFYRCLPLDSSLTTMTHNEITIEIMSELYSTVNEWLQEQ